jgi:hypothetical protein
MSLPGFLETEDALTDFLESFERGSWPKSAWTHAAHVAVAACYLIEYPDEAAANHMRRGIVHYNHCVGTVNSDHSGYHETITLFWLAIVKARLCDLPRIEAVRLLYQNWPRSAICSRSTTASTSYVPYKPANPGSPQI